MIEALKKTYDAIYAPDAQKERYPVIVPIEKPYLYVEPDADISSVIKPEQNLGGTPPHKVVPNELVGLSTFFVNLWNAGGSDLSIDGVEISPESESWITAESVKGISIGVFEERSIGLIVDKKNLPQIDSKTTIQVKSNSVSNRFSSLSINFHPQRGSPQIDAPEALYWGDIPLLKLHIGDVESTKEFYLAGDFVDFPPLRLKMAIKNSPEETRITVNVFSKRREYEYYFGMDSSGIIPPESVYLTRITRRRGRRVSFRASKRSIKIANLSGKPFTGEVTSTATWLTAPQECVIEGKSDISLSVEANLSTLQFGRHFSQLRIRQQQDIIDTRETSPTDEAGDVTIGVYANVTVIEEIGVEGKLTINEKAKNQEFTVEFENSEKTKLRVEPKTIDYGEIPLFEDVTFSFQDVGMEADTTAEVFLSGDFNNWENSPVSVLSGCIPSLKTNPIKPEVLATSATSYNTTLSLPDGEYNYRYQVGSEQRLDLFRLNEIIIGEHGTCSKMNINRRERELSIKNLYGWRFEGRVETTSPWLNISEERLSIPSNDTVFLTVSIVPDNLKIGPNSTTIEIIPDASEEPKYRIPVNLFAYTNGVMPILRTTDFKLGHVKKGGKLNQTLNVEAAGVGELTGRIIPHNIAQFSEEKLRIVNQDAWENRIFSQNLIIDATMLMNAPEGGIEVFMVTDCYIVNRRVIKLSYHYSMEYLHLSPPVLYFPEVFLNDAKQLAIVTVRHSEGSEIKLRADIPDNLQGMLTLASTPANGKCEFIFDPSTKGQTQLSSRISIHDEISGISEFLPFQADITESKSAVTPVYTLTVFKQPETDFIQLDISNVGDADLKVHSVDFEHGRFRIVPPLTQPLMLPPEHGHQFKIMANTTPLFGKEIVEDNLIVVSNDSSQPTQRLPIKMTVITKISKFLRSR